jgi:ubiquitin-activating enzyme E1
MTRTRDLGANFYLTEAHVGNKSRADGCHGKL